MVTEDRPIRVLHVDDPGSVETVADVVDHEEGRFDVETATSADGGVERLVTDEFDCVVSAYELPDRNGVAFLEAVRERYPELPFVLYTGQGSEDVASDAISADVTEYLPKGNGTVEYADLAERIETAVEAYRTRPAPAEGDRRLDRPEDRYRTLANRFPNGGVHYFDDELRYRSVSGDGFDAIETSPDDLVGHTIYDVESYSEEIVETLEPLMEATLDGQRETTELRYEGHVYRLHSAPIRDADGSVTAGFFIAQDVTEQHRREQELAALSTAMQASIDGMAILDDDDEYVFVNQAHADIYGYDDPEAFRGETWRTCYDAEEVDRFEDDILPTLYDRGNWRGEATGTRRDGSTFPQELSLSITDDGRIICVVRDVTERKERERELKRHNERLEKLVSTVSHDLRNPLTVAKGRLQLARAEYDSDDLDSAASSIDRTLELVDELLTLARQGTNIGDVEAVDLSAVVDRCWGNVATAGATLQVELDRTERVRADPSRLGQLLENLIRNAVEHGSTSPRSQAPEDSVEHGSTGNRAKPGDSEGSEIPQADGEAVDSVEYGSTDGESGATGDHGDHDVAVTVGDLDDGFYVADDGPGIPPSERERVREAGYSTAHDGSGFGLSIVHDVAEAHGWTLSITDSESGGARFEITGVEFAE
jgi:PAS domain S-box-containing protein